MRRGADEDVLGEGGRKRINAVDRERSSIMSCTVNNLSEYIAAIEENALYDCISRGEHRRYEAPLRSAILRKQTPECYDELLQEYFSQFEAELTDLQSKHFIAFSQHHGIPTNLLDFSKSPLVSLYFATEFCEDKGNVYFIKKSKLVDAGKLINSNPYGWGLLDDLLNFDIDTLRPIAHQLARAFKRNSQEMVDFFILHTEEFIARYNHLYSMMDDHNVNALKAALQTFLKDREEWDREPSLQVYSSYSNFVNSFFKVYRQDEILFPQKTFENYKKANSIANTDLYEDGWPSVQLILLLMKFDVLIQFFDGYPFANTNKEIELPFYFSYSPPMIDNRVRNQSSIFVFQPFQRDDYINGKDQVRYWQRIAPDFEIKIENPESIQKELDAIGINRKYIYCDYDNAAKYTIDYFFGEKQTGIRN